MFIFFFEDESKFPWIWAVCNADATDESSTRFTLFCEVEIFHFFPSFLACITFTKRLTAIFDQNREKMTRKFRCMKYTLTRDRCCTIIWISLSFILNFRLQFGCYVWLSIYVTRVDRKCIDFVRRFFLG